MAWGSHITQNTLDEIFWAGHNSTSQMRVFSWQEGSGTYVVFGRPAETTCREQ